MTTIGEWHDWFAWYPVGTWQGERWLCMVKRRRISVPDYLWRVQKSWWEYK